MRARVRVEKIMKSSPWVVNFHPAQKSKIIDLCLIGPREIFGEEALFK
jgi:hypothetical protein